MTGPVFLPWLRRGLSRGLGDVDPLSGPLPVRGVLTARVTVVDDTGASTSVERVRTVLGPGDAIGVDPQQILRLEPPDEATDVEDNHLPFVEFAGPDLPWLLSPARPDDAGALRPWLALVCVSIPEPGEPGAVLDDTAGPCPVLRLDAATAAAELPDLAESWAWAHVHSAVPATAVAASLEAGDGAVTSRLLCPRRLRPGRRYRAALVPAFEAGRDAGLGREPAGDATHTGPAWDIAALPPTLELPVYATWTFRTSAVAGDFEELCMRLEPDTAGGRLGYRAARIDDRGLLEPFAAATEFEYAGLLVDPDSRGADLAPAAARWFRTGMTRRLTDAATRRTVTAQEPADYVPDRDDPVIGPPLHGQWAADRHELPAVGWLAETNLRPDRRAAAGLGARIVRRHQEELLAAAWQQAGQLRALRDELNRARLAAEVGRSQARRLAALDDGRALQATARLHAYLRTDTGTVAQRLAGSAVVPSALVSAAFQRQIRPGAPVGRRLAVPRGAPRPSAVVTDAFLRASAPTSERPVAAERCARFGATFVPDGAITTDTVFGSTTRFDPTLPSDWFGGIVVPRPIDLQPDDPARVRPGTLEPGPQQPDERQPDERQPNKNKQNPDELDQERRGAATRRGRDPARPSRPDRPGPGTSPARTVLPGHPVVGTADDDAPLVAVQPVPRIVTTAADDVRDVAGQVRRRLDPMPAAVRQLQVRVAGVDLDPAADLPVRLAVGARFDLPLAPWLLELGTEFLLPGVEGIAPNRVRMLAVNEAAVAALLVGANHEWDREALWREYPADLGATSFRSFWPAVVPDRTDLDADLHTWDIASSLADHVGGVGSTTVLLVRGDVIRRYPACEFLLVEPAADGSALDGDRLPAERITRPSFASRLDPGTVVVGFDVDPDTVLDGGWFLGLEEPLTGPRFGLDVGDPADVRTVPASWHDLSWGHVSPDRAAMDAADHLVLAAPAWLAGVERDGATWARNGAHVAASLFQRPFRVLFPADHLVPRSTGTRR